MIEISQEEFEAKVQDIIDGKTTRVKLIKELKVDRITLNTKIQELAAYNPELYKKFIIKFPYRPREYTHIDYEAIIIDILKKGYTRREWDTVYEVDSRTINRKIHDIEEKNPELVSLYRKVSEYRKRQMKLPVELKKAIEELEEKEIYLCDVCDNKRKELLKREKEYNDAMNSGMGATQASRKVGQGRVSKAIDTLSRIELERRTIEDNKKNTENNNRNDEEGER